ncbi:hypothetical protein H2200_008183 [Cladophialophora chaetospira]|uniref:Uncharacterized protein n=1 Tax=Cladophialophora chaetospira TaxID=386627 RepID=A0AA38X5F1_9EURO|nr:hypothetical protein H2200_008183 [Cladophialophora chaetospira]
MADPICIPIDLDAFVLNEAVCEGGKTRIAPITKPDYVSLRLENSAIQHDVLPKVDLHNTDKAINNPRISESFSGPLKVLDLKNPNPPETQLVRIKESRLGVYLHWSLPRGYRSGTSAAAGTDKANNAAQASANPVFRPVPNRWLVVRSLHPNTFSPQPAGLPLISAWIIESDRMQAIEDIDGKVDLETDVSPFIQYDNTVPGNVLHSQAEKYIGSKTALANVNQWTEQGNPPISKLTVMSTSNSLFADYTAHNANVFSMKDNFEFAKDSYLQTATCDYFVVGWHSDVSDGPFGKTGIPGTLESRINTFLCSIDKDAKLAGLSVKAAKAIKDSLDFTATLCHGAIYNVVYDRHAKPKSPTPSSDDYVDNFTTNVDMEPVAVGVSPLDSILTFLNAHDKDTAAEEHILGTGSNQIAHNILSMSELLYATDDDYDSRIKAADLLSAQHFKGNAGGFTWHYDKKKESNGPPQSPSTDPTINGKSELDHLNMLNELQQNLDMTERVLATRRWDLFAQFFNYCADPLSGANESTYVGLVKKLYSQDPTSKKWTGALADLLQTKNTLETAINDILQPKAHPNTPLIPVRKIANDPYYLRSNPTLMIAGIDAGWPADFLKNIEVRFGSEITIPASKDLSDVVAKLKLPPASGDLGAKILNLLAEAAQSGTANKPGFKTWAGQPFHPIFVEWEAVYYHLDWSENWQVGLGSSPLSPNNVPQIRYVNTESVLGLCDDARAVSGRILVLPQPNFALKAVIDQVFGSTTSADLPPGMQKWTETQKQAFADSVDQLKFISGELDGFTDGLLTLANGSHVKPNVRPQGQDAAPLQEAIDKGSHVGLTRDHFVEIDSESAKTPYGGLEDFVGAKFQPFKGVQHGQLAITKITIVDKFGQAVCCPLPAAQPTSPPKDPDFPLRPCLTDRLCPSMLSDGTLNTVYKTTDKFTSTGAPISPFIQITPSINQSARINADFLEVEIDSSGKATGNWAVCTEWENPIFGWIIVNYADSCLQFFTGKGLFFTTAHFGGQTGTATSLKWAPFASPPPGDEQKYVSTQLVNLISQLQGGTQAAQDYLAGLWDMIEQAIQTMPFPPSQYSGYANAIVGKPLALVNVAWSLELGQPPLKAQHTLGPKPGDTKAGFLNPTEEEVMASYQFHVKIGDWARPFDGVVCYWDNDKPPAGSTDFAKIHTYFPQEEAVLPRISITTETYPKLTPFFLQPSSSGTGLAQEKLQHSIIKTLLIDPYTPIHLYSGILPINSLQLPGWSLQIAMRNMTAFFTVGPILVTTDVPKVYDPNQKLTADSWITHMADPKASPDACKVKLPIAGGKGMWNWLQPYVDTTTPATNTKAATTTATKAVTTTKASTTAVKKDDSGDDDALPRPLYNAFEVGNDDGRLRSDPGPYTMLEGFLQLARPLINDSSS